MFINYIDAYENEQYIYNQPIFYVLVDFHSLSQLWDTVKKFLYRVSQTAFLVFSNSVCVLKYEAIKEFIKKLLFPEFVEFALYKSMSLFVLCGDDIVVLHFNLLNANFIKLIY